MSDTWVSSHTHIQKNVRNVSQMLKVMASGINNYLETLRKTSNSIALQWGQFQKGSLFVQAGVQMPAIQRPSSRRRACCTGTAHLNHGITLLFTWICGRGGSSQTPLKSSPWYDLRETAEVYRTHYVWATGRYQAFKVQDWTIMKGCDKKSYSEVNTENETMF